MRFGSALLVVGALIAATPADAFAQKKQRDVITNEEIAASGQRDLDLLQAVKALRPHFLEMPRGQRSLGGGAIYPILIVIDGRRGEEDGLTNVRAIDAKEVRYLDPSKSQNEFGINANSGAIVVKLMSAKDKEKKKEDKPKDPPKDL
jgi:hypothetical protein